jgi:hypothetical protein
MPTPAGLQMWKLDLEKPKRRRTTPRRKQIRMPGLPAAPGASARENEAGDMLAGLMRARLAPMPQQVAEDYRDLAARDDPTAAEKARLSMLEDTYAASRQQPQAAISEVHTKREAKSRDRSAAGSPHRVGSSQT